MPKNMKPLKPLKPLNPNTAKPANAVTSGWFSQHRDMTLSADSTYQWWCVKHGIVQPVTAGVSVEDEDEHLEHSGTNFGPFLCEHCRKLVELQDVTTGTMKLKNAVLKARMKVL